MKFEISSRFLLLFHNCVSMSSQQQQQPNPPPVPKRRHMVPERSPHNVPERSIHNVPERSLHIVPDRSLHTNTEKEGLINSFRDASGVEQKHVDLARACLQAGGNIYQLLPFESILERNRVSPRTG